MEHTADPSADAMVDAQGPDRDLAALQALESELASLEGELDRVEGSEPNAPSSEGLGPDAAPDGAGPDESPG